jgi:hypothetical protein
MTNETFKGIEKLEADLWEAADNLRANSKLTFQPAGSPDFPGRHRGDWKVAPTRRQERLLYVTIPSRSLANLGIQVHWSHSSHGETGVARNCVTGIQFTS